MWSRVIDGRILNFRLGGINNQNLVMIDDETGSWWQQITGECLFGPLQGKRLERIASDELTLAAWRAEHPESTAVLLQDKFMRQYAKPDWERSIAGLPAPDAGDSRIPARELIVGIEVDGRAAAYPVALLKKQSPINHVAGGVPVLVMIGADGQSVRSFRRGSSDYYALPGSDPLILIDSETGSRWDFQGRCVQGPRAGSQLERIQNMKDYWFNWKRYHPETILYRAGESLSERRN